MACSIIRNKQTNEIEKVLAPNGQESKLYQDILKMNPDKEAALRMWAQVYTPGFKKWFGDWEKGQETSVTEIGKVFKDASKFSQEDFDTLKDMGYTEDEILDKLGAKKSDLVFTKNIIPQRLDDNGEPLLIDHRLDSYGFSSFDRGTSSKEDDSIQFNRTSIPLMAEEEQKQTIGDNIAFSLANRIASQMGISYNLITAEQARQLSDKWNGEGAFYLNGQVYMVEGHFTTENVLHEYSHPLIDAIFADNKALFNKLYETVSGTPEGQKIIDEVKELYPEYAEGDPNFTKEVIVRALTAQAQNQIAGVESSKGLKEFVNKVIFAIKQALRKVFGTSIKIDKLSTNTTLSELAKMLKSDNFDINTELVSEKDQIQFAREVTDFLNSLEDVQNDKLSTVVQNFYNITSNQVRRVMKNKNYSEARKILVDAAGKGLLQGIKATLENTEVDKKLAELLDETELRKKNATNFIHSILQLEILTKKMSEHMRDIKSKKDAKEVLNDIFYYDLLVRNWEKFIKESNETLIDNGMDPASTLGEKMSSLQTRIESIKRKVNEYYTPGLVEVLKESLAPLNKGIDEYYSKWIESAKKRGASQKFIDRKMKDWEEAKLTDEKLKDIIEGKYGDTNYFSAYLEAFTNSPDPIVGGFANFLKNSYNVVEADFQREMNSFVKEIYPLLEKAGYSRSNFVSLMQKLVFKDKYTYLDIATGKPVTKERWSFLNQFKDVTVQLQKYRFDIEDAENKGDSEEVNRLVAEQRQHLKDFFNQEYKDEYYARESIYDTYDGYDDLEKLTLETLGIDKKKATPQQIADAKAYYKEKAQEAYKRKYTIIYAVKELDSLNYDEIAFEENAEQKKLLWREYSQLASSTDLNGNPKQGEEKLISAIEKKYRKESNKFFEWIPIEGQFEFALNRFEQGLLDAGIAQGTPEFDAKREAWIKNNTVISYTPEFYQERNELLTRLKEVMAKIPEEVRENIDSSNEMEQLLGIATGFRDQDGQIIGTELSDKSVEKIKQLQQSIANKRNKMAGYSGLTKDEMTEMMLIYNRSGGGKNLTPEQRTRLKELQLKKDSLGVNGAVKAELQAIYSQLGDLQSKEATDYYMDIMDNWFQKMGEPAPTKESVEMVLHPEQYVRLFKKDAEFEKWFKENHIAKEVYDKSAGENIIIYERLFMWNHTHPNNEEHYEKITLPSGEEIKGKPNLSYYYRRVKDEFRTEKIVGQTVDNKGNWLPKTVAEGAKDDRYENKDYDKLRRTDPAAFALLEKMKEYHLKNQEDAPRESKLYMEIPRYRSMASETLLQPKKGVNKGRQLWYNLKSKFVKRNDDYQDEVNELDFNPSTLVSTNMFDEEIRKIPVTGMYDLKPEEVSMNILDGMMQYRSSVLHQKKLIELNPIAQAFQSVLKDPRNAVNTGKFSKWHWKKFRSLAPIKDKDISVRARAITNLYEREFEGKYQNQEFIKRFPAIQKVKSTITGMASLGFFALNIPSAFKNKIAAQEQALIEAAGGRFLNLSSLMKGKVRAGKMLATYSSEVYFTKNKSLDVQLMQIFNPVQEMFEHMTKEQFGRSILSDTANLSVLFAPRKFLQTKATLDLFCGMLYHTKVKQTINGKTNEIPYINAWEIKNGQIELKPGIDEKYAPGGTEFNAIKNKTHELVNRLEGTYSRMDQPEINRNFYYQCTVFLKKFFTSMFMNHFAARRPSAALGTISTGNYTNLYYIARDMLRYGFKYSMYMNEEERATFKKTVALSASMVIMNSLLITAMLGYDGPEDKERFNRMRKRSGDLISKDFNFGGWMANQELVIALGVVTETGTWYNPKLFLNTIGGLPQPSGLFNTGFVKPAVMISDAIHGNKYKKDAGPYSFQKEGGSKALTTLAKYFGFTGQTVDPTEAIRSIEAQRSGFFK